MRKLLSITALAVLAASAQVASGLDIVIDFGNHTTSTGNVNNICPTGANSTNGATNLNWTSSTLTDYTTGLSTSDTVTITSAPGSTLYFRSDPSADYSAWGGSRSGWVTSNITDDFIYGTVEGSWLTATVNGLTAGASYKLSLISGADPSDYGGGSPYTYRIKANNAYASAETGSATKTYGNGWDATVEGYTNYLTWDSVTADSNGKIAISLADIAGDGYANIFLNGLRLTSNPVPEPSEAAATLGILALAGCLLRKKLRRSR
jgi:hypothetical protein